MTTFEKILLGMVLVNMIVNFLLCFLFIGLARSSRYVKSVERQLAFLRELYLEEKDENESLNDFVRTITAPLHPQHKGVYVTRDMGEA